MVPNPIGWDEPIAPTSLGFETFGQAGNWCRYICRRISFSWGHTHGSRPVFSAGLAIARTIAGQRNRKSKVREGVAIVIIRDMIGGQLWRGAGQRGRARDLSSLCAVRCEIRGGRRWYL